MSLLVGTGWDSGSPHRPHFFQFVPLHRHHFVTAVEGNMLHVLYCVVVTNLTKLQWKGSLSNEQRKDADLQRLLCCHVYNYLLTTCLHTASESFHSLHWRNALVCNEGPQPKITTRSPSHKKMECPSLRFSQQSTDQ